MHQQVTKYLTLFRAVGWGVRTVTHYDWKLEFEFKGPGAKQKTPGKSSWKPEIYPSMASRISKFADIGMACMRHGTSKKGSGVDYGASFILEAEDELGCRVPLKGSMAFEDYTQENPGYTNWDTFEATYEAVRAQWKIDQAAFTKANQPTPVKKEQP
jgi:hypothetical protein